MILNLFALPICKTNLRDSGVDFESLKSLLLPIFELAKNKNADLERQGGVSTYFTDNQLHKREEFKTLSEFVLQQARAYWTVLDVYEGLEPEIDLCWSNIHTDNSYTSHHSHSLSPVVASFYLEAPKNSGDIVFINPMEYSLTHIPHNAAIESIIETAVHIETGDLVLFPGWVRHKTQENNSGKDRIVITFNLRYKGKYLLSQVDYPEVSKNTDSYLDFLTNRVYQQQMIIDQLKRVMS
jgi:uncharacterized protein (TIGR02466 family)